MAIWFWLLHDGTMVKIRNFMVFIKIKVKTEREFNMESVQN